ncbi:WXG100 family type VII secretion target [Streptomyces sp. 21So2-11]|uniref:WXG100 family type VII secretion target n=1 Tax=Streptomyces sp. 21So2-11 TaxID=3144408 RepID=UPI00321A641C
MVHGDGTLVVTYAKLDETALEIRNQGKRLEESLQAIKAKISAVSELWEGEAREAYNIAQRDWDKQATEIHASLATISNQIAEASAAYRRADQKGGQGFHPGA